MTIGESVTAPAAAARRSRGGAVLIGALVVDSIGNGLFLPLGLIFFTRITDVPLALIGVLLSVANVMQLPIPLFAGALVDRFGALPLVVLAQVLQALGYAAAGMVHGSVGILLSAVLTALGVRFFWSSIFTLIADYVDGRDGAQSKDYWYGWANMARTAGLGVGGVLTGIALASPHTGQQTFRMIAFGAAACFAVAAVTIALVVRAPRAKQQDVPSLQGYRALMRDRPYLGLVLVNAVFALSTMMLALALPTLVLLHLHAPGWLVSGLLVGNTVVVSVVTAPVVLRLRRFRRTRVVATAAALWAVWALLLAVLRPEHLSWAIPLLVASTLLYTAATVIHAPVSMGLAAAAAPADTRGRYLAIFQYSFTLAEVVGPSFFTMLFAAYHGLPWVALAALNGVAILAVLALERRLPAAAVRDD
ncbi:MFS transporter [Micromonospora sp. WMMD712]|uniref:MFS transporter n=1 Tax=Micromonospora sp. WMMD712 TaxID=3016096 RepID=UPI00249A8A35|nr:MFS transporter [Micromonospora sp. WMMD712]WFE60207.1 MFS transporter [Micromonospora sp. WMMD712]